MVKVAPLRVAQVIEAVDGTVVLNRAGDAAAAGRHEIRQLGEPLEVGAEGLAFVISGVFVEDAAKTQAEVVVVQASLSERVLAVLPATVKVVVSSADAYLGLARLSAVVAKAEPLFDWPASSESGGTPEVHASARVASQASVCAGATIGPRTVIHPGAVIGPGARVGADCIVFPGVVVYPRTVIGDRVRIHANCVVGSDGFGYARGPQGSVKIWHLGRVVIEDDVEIGAGTMVDRGTLKDTIIERGAKIDNLCQIGHNGHVKAHAILCAQVGMAGNVTVGRGAILAGKVGVADKIEIGDGALIGPMSGLSKDVKAGDQVMGQQPAKPRREWWKLIALFERLPEFNERLKKLENPEGGKRG